MKKSKKIVAMSGSFDLLHRGHIRSLQMAKRLGDELVVLLKSDSSIRSYKGPSRPIMSEDERCEILLSLKPVDRVILFDEITPLRALAKLKPDIFCNGKDYGKDCIERSVVESYGGKIKILDWSKGISTTDIIKKIQMSSALPDIRAVFIDRDGIINVDSGYVHTIEDFIFMPGVIEGVEKLSLAGYKIIIVTNQSGVARGMYPESDVTRLHLWLKKQLPIDAVYYCPHGPEDGCECRKPGIGMFLKAVDEFGVALSKSWMIGDTDRDIVAGRHANVKTIKLGKKMNPELKLQPHHYVTTFHEAVDLIV